MNVGNQTVLVTIDFVSLYGQRKNTETFIKICSTEEVSHIVLELHAVNVNDDRACILR